MTPNNAVQGTLRDKAPRSAPEDRISFITYIAGNPDAGDVVPGSGGVRKARWGTAGRGKRGGVRVIYFNRLANGEIWLLRMPKLPRVSGAAVVRALERLGFEKARQSGSHVIMRRGPNGCVVPLKPRQSPELERSAP